MGSLNNAQFTHEHFACVDMVHIDCCQTANNRLSESAVLLEIWEGGALVQTSSPVANGSPISIVVNKKTDIAAEVTSCEADSEYGYLLTIEVDAPAKWFPLGYTPPWHHQSGDDLDAEASLATPGGFVC